MAEDNIKNLENLPVKVWKELKQRAEEMVQNSKIGFYQGTVLADLASRQISDIEKKDSAPAEADDVLKEALELIKEA